MISLVQSGGTAVVVVEPTENRFRSESCPGTYLLGALNLSERVLESVGEYPGVVGLDCSKRRIAGLAGIPESDAR